MPVVVPNEGKIKGLSDGDRALGWDVPDLLGFGLGLRNVHFEHILSQWPKVDWFEAISENFMDSGGRPRDVLRKVADRYPVILHGVSLSIGSTDPLDFDYLARLKVLIEEVEPPWVSDHLCWTGVLGENSHDLLPLPLTEDVLSHVAERVLRVQDFLGRPLVLENPSSYMSFKQSTIDEPTFFRRLANMTDCGLLLDVNNVFVSCFNAGTDPVEYIESYPHHRVVQIHLAGHQDCGTHIIDTHDSPVRSEVWQLYALAWKLTGGASTLLEWDGNIPDFDTCHAEVLKAKQYTDDNRLPLCDFKPDICAQDMVSTPVDFLVPDVMADMVLEDS